MRKTAVLLLILALLSALIGASAESALGQPLNDFTVETIDGGAFTLSEALADKDMVLINLWATWCPPCEMEFPYLEEAYEQYSDRVAVIALSIEPTDTPEKLRDYADSHGLTFPVGSDSQTNLFSLFNTGAIPTSFVVDRFGSIALVEAGAQSSVTAFTALFDYFLADDYAETTVLDGFPAPRPVSAADDAALSAAANAQGRTLTFQNPEDGVTWPMLPTEDAGRAALVSSNAGVDNSAAMVYTTVTAAEGDALVFDFRTSTQLASDALFVAIDGETVKSFTGEHDWTAWTVPLPAGEHEITFGYSKDEYTDEGADSAWISNVRVASGAEAEALLNALPPRPMGEALAAAPGGEGAIPVIFDDPSGMMEHYFGTKQGWIVDGETASVEITLTEAEDPETVLCYDANGTYRVSDGLKSDGSGYAVSVPLASDDYDMVVVQASPTSDQMQALLMFDGEAGAEAFTEYLAMYGIDVSWQYAE